MTYNQTQKLDLINNLKSLFSNLKKYPVFMCVGSDKIVMDSLAPVVSELLTKKYNIPAFVYGGLEYNINAKNLLYSKHFIEIMHPDSKIFVIDATIGERGELGQVKLVLDGVIPAANTLDFPKKIGDYAILGVVGTGGINDKIVLGSTKMQDIIDMAEFIAESLAKAILSVNIV